MREWMGSNRNGLAIVRVSSRRQTDNTSHEVQEADIRSYSERHGIKLVQVFRITESAKDSDFRVEYNLAIKHALTNDIRHVLFYMYDREARNLTDNEKNEKLVRADVLCLHYVREGKVLHADSPDSDFFIRDVQAAANKQYSRNLSVKVRDALEQKAEGGQYPGHRPPLGYVHEKLKDSEGRPLKAGTRIIPDPDHRMVRWVQREFELRASGLSFREIRKRALEEGLVPTAQIKTYTHGIIEHRIKNIFYRGRFMWKDKEYKGAHELIIPTDVLDKVARSFMGRRMAVLDGEVGVFGGGWLRCAFCGCGVVYEQKRKKYRDGSEATFHYYRCNNGKRIHNSLSGLYCSEAKIWEQFGSAVDSISLSAEFAKKIAEALSDNDTATTSGLKAEVRRHKISLDALNAREDQQYEDFRAGVLPGDAFKRLSEKIRNERREVQAAIESAQRALSGSAKETAQSIIELCKNAKSLFNSRSAWERKEFLNLLISNPQLRGTTIEFNLKKPFAVLREMSSGVEWLAR